MRSVGTLLVLGVMLLWAAENASAKKIPRWWLKVAERQGPNACVVEEIPGTSKEFWTECRYWLNRKICGKKTRIRFECCEGFDQIEGEDGCTLVKPLKNLLETAESLGATKWAAYIRESGLQNELESAGAYTLFAPTNEAFDGIKESLQSQLDSYRGNPSNPILLYHIVPSKLRSEDFDGDQTVETRHQGHTIRINKYSNGMTTINCAQLARKDQEATNGIVHVIDGVLDPSVGIANNVADMVLNDGRFQVLAEMLEKSGYINVLRTLQDSISILAPSDEAFQKLPDSRREKIINDREARLALLQNHVIPHVICESAITGEHRVRTMSNNKLTFNCDIDGAYVENTKLRGNFNLGKNGIIHMIDDVLLPDRAKNLVELAESRQLETFVDFVKRSGLEETLSHTGDYTFFVPDENAWLEMPPEAMAEARRNPEYAGLMLRFHGAYGRHLTNAITDNQAIMSLDEENPVRLQVWRRALGVEDAKITESDLEAQNGVIHIINKVIFPSNRSVEDILDSIKENSFYSFQELLKQVTTDDPSVLSLGPGEDTFYTFFVPTDQAFDGFDQTKLNNILEDGEKRTELVTNHVASSMFPETSFEPGLIYAIEGAQSNFNVRKNPDGRLTVNDANVLSSHMSANGVIHVIDKVFEPTFQSYSTVKRTSVSTVTHQDGSTSTRTYTSTRRSSSGSAQHSNRVSGVTVNEDFGNDFEKILPAYPQGSVIVGSVQRKPEHVMPPAKRGRKTRRRDRLNNRTHRTSTTSSTTTTTSTTTPSTTTTPTTTTPTTTTTPSTTTTTTTPSTTTTTTTPPTTTTTTTTSTTTTASTTPYSSRRTTGTTSRRASWPLITITEVEHDSASRSHRPIETKPDVLHVVQGNRVYESVGKETHVNRYKDNDLRGSVSQTRGKEYDDHLRRSEINRGLTDNQEDYLYHNRQRVYDDHHNNQRTTPNERIHNKQYIRTQYDKSYYNQNNARYNVSNSSSFKPTLTTYNRNWDVPIPSPPNITTEYSYERHAANTSHSRYPLYAPVSSVDLDGSRDSNLKQSKKVYSYSSYSSTVDDNAVDASLLHGNRGQSDIYPNQLLSSSSSTSKVNNPLARTSPEGGRFNYVGHHYGNDVIGHDSKPLSLSSPGSTYVARNSSTNREILRPVPFAIDTSTGSKIHGVSTVTHSKRVGVTRTIYTVPSRSSSYLEKSHRTFAFPINKKPIPSMGLNGKPRSDLLSAYAFTGEEKDFADGADFSEARVPSEQIVTVEQAKILRRQWRRKRHQRRKKNRKNRRTAGRRGDKNRRKRKQRKPTLP